MNITMPITTATITSSGAITPATIAPILLSSSSSSSVIPVDATVRKSSSTNNGPGCPYDRKDTSVLCTMIIIPTMKCSYV